MANQPDLIPSAWAANNSTTETIPATTTESGKASWDQGFPVETSLPLSQGGIPPKYGDFNGVLNVLSQFCLFAQAGGQFTWSSTLAYSVGSIVVGSDGSIYRAVQATTNVNPVGDTSGKWERIVSKSDIDALEEDIQDAIDAATDAVSNASAAQSAVTTLDANVVKLSGTQTVGGAKTFTNDITTENANPSYACKITSIERANNPNSDTWTYPVKYLDKNGDFLGYVELYFGPLGQRRARLCTYKQDGSTAYIQVGFDKNGVAYTNAVTPSTANSNSTEIATTAWVTSATAVVHTTGNQQIDGEKTMIISPIIKRANPYLYFQETDQSKGAGVSGSSYAGVVFQDKDGLGMGALIGRLFGNAGEKNYGLILNITDPTSSASTTEYQVQFSWYQAGTKAFEPSVSDAILLGRNSRKWKEIWCNQNSLNTSSDERIKQQITQVPDDVLDAWADINWIQFKFNDACEEKGKEQARLHNGLIAQRVDEAFRTHKLDASKYGLFLYDQWDATPEEKGEDGHTICPSQPAGDAYGLRYTECLCMEAAYQRRRADRAEARITALEQRLGELEAVLASLISPISEEQTAEPKEGEGDE